MNGKHVGSVFSLRSSSGSGRLLGQEDRMDVGKNSTLGDGDSTQKLVELFIVPDGQLKVTRNDPGFLVVPGSVPSKLKDLGSEILHDGSEVDRSTTSNPSAVVSLAEKTVDPSNRELQASPGRPRLGLGTDLLGLVLHGGVGGHVG